MSRFVCKFNSTLTCALQGGKSVQEQCGYSQMDFFSPQTYIRMHTRLYTHNHQQQKAQSQTCAVRELQDRMFACSCGSECLCVNVNLHMYETVSKKVPGIVSLYFRLVEEKVILKKALYRLKCHA